MEMALAPVGKSTLADARQQAITALKRTTKPITSEVNAQEFKVLYCADTGAFGSGHDDPRTCPRPGRVLLSTCDDVSLGFHRKQ
jgi:hypothetical protein